MKILCCLCIVLAVASARPEVVISRLPTGQTIITPHDNDREIQWVTGNIAIGNINAALNVQHLVDEGVTHVVSLIGRVADYTQWPLEATALDVMDIPGQDMTVAFQEANDVITRVTTNGGRVLVHCAAGVSRSSATIIYHLMTERGMHYDSALDLVREARDIAQPNYGFERQLRALEVKKEL